MQPDQITPELQMEVIRRRAELGASSAGIGAETTNDLGPQNPIANELGTQGMTNPPPMQGGAAGVPSAGATGALKEQKGEARTLIDAMIFRLKKLTERGE